MHAFVLVALIIAAAAFAAATIGVAARVNLIALGLLAYVLSVLLPRLN